MPSQMPDNESLFLAVPWVCLQFVIVVFPDHTLLIFRLYDETGLKLSWVGWCRVSTKGFLQLGLNLFPVLDKNPPCELNSL